MKTKSKKNIRFIVFDVGGVLLRLSGMSNFIEWTGLSTTEIKNRWLACEVVRQFETGRISSDEFAERFVDEWDILLSSQEFVVKFASWTRELYPGVDQLLMRIAKVKPIACFTNTNPLQWPMIRDDLGLGAYFEKQFVSYEMGFVKPSQKAYSVVAEELGVERSGILLFDDSEINIHAGIQAGFECYFVNGIFDIERRLNEYRFFV